MKPADGSLPSKSYFGTGDIEPPILPQGIEVEHERAKIVPTPWQDWASINEQASKASAEKKEWLAEQLALGKLKTKPQVKAALIHLGCDEAEIERQRMTPAMAAHVAEKLRAIAVYATAEALPYQAELAKENTNAFIAVAKMGEVLKAQGVQVNTYVDKRNGGDDMGDRQFFQNFHKRNQLKIVGGAADPDPDPPEDEPTEPAP